jgi:hypothetical protein
MSSFSKISVPRSARHGERRYAKLFGCPRRVDVQSGESMNGDR